MDIPWTVGLDEEHGLLVAFHFRHVGRFVEEREVRAGAKTLLLITHSERGIKENYSTPTLSDGIMVLALE